MFQIVPSQQILVKNGSDSCKKHDSAIQSLQNELDLGERPDAAPVRSQITVLEMDFDLMARNSASCTTTILGEVLRDKRWNELLVDLGLQCARSLSVETRMAAALSDRSSF